MFKQNVHLKKPLTFGLMSMTFVLAVLIMTGCNTESAVNPSSEPNVTGRAVQSAQAAGPVSGEKLNPNETDTFFICPSVGTESPNGRWVIGKHGAYYVKVPMNGATGSRIFLTVPVTVPNLAGIPAGWGLYKDLPSYPYFEGKAVVLSEGIKNWLNNAPGFQEGDVVTVVNNGNGTYTVTVVGFSPILLSGTPDIGNQVTIDHTIPLESAEIW